MTGRLVRTSPGHPWRTAPAPRTRTGSSFHVPAQGAARVGLSGATAKGAPPLTRCTAPAADMPVTDGAFTLRDGSPRDGAATAHGQRRSTAGRTCETSPGRVDHPGISLDRFRCA
ncbi:hypothetical protein ACFVW2_26240 [Streptomyces sp. NPDC058171]